MITREEAEKRFKDFRYETIEERKAGLDTPILALPDSLRRFALAFLGRGPNNVELGYYNREEVVAPIFWDFDQVSAEDRKEVFGAIAPKMVDALETTWTYLLGQPYTSGYSRKAMRAPKHPGWSLTRRYESFSLLLTNLASYRKEVVDVPWLLAWATYEPHSLGWGAGIVGAAVISAGGSAGDAAFEVLSRSLVNDHEIGGMGRHVIAGLLGGTNPAGWELIEKTLLAAQRQEGLRQSILEAVDESHPTAFRRMLKLVIDHDLARFSATVRSLNVWMGLNWDSVSLGVVNKSLSAILELLDDEAVRNKALEGADAERAYMALWAVAFEDAPATLPLIKKLLTHKSAATRYAAVTMAGHLSAGDARYAVLPAIDDENLLVSLAAMSVAATSSADVTGEKDEVRFAKLNEEAFPAAERVLARMPDKPIKLKPLIWPWTEREASRQDVVNRLFNFRGQLPISRIMQHRDDLSPRHRSWLVRELVEKKWSPEDADMLLDFTGDTAADVRESALKGLGKNPLRPEDPPRLEKLLTRKSADLRRGVLDLLLKLPDEAAHASAERLMAGDAQQRLAGLELLRHLAEANRDRPKCLARAEAYKSSRKKINDDEQTQLTAIATVGEVKPSLDNGLGMFDPAKLSEGEPPVDHKTRVLTPAAAGCLKAIDDLVHEHRETKITVTSGWRPGEYILGTINYYFPNVDYDKPIAKQLSQLPLREVWEGWLKNRGNDLRDPDGLELERAAFALNKFHGWSMNELNEWNKDNEKRTALCQQVVGGEVADLQYQNVTSSVLYWLRAMENKSHQTEAWRLAWAETAVAAAMESEPELPPRQAKEPTQVEPGTDDPVLQRQLEALDYLEAKFSELDDKLSCWKASPYPAFLCEEMRSATKYTTPELLKRKWRLSRWYDALHLPKGRYRPAFDVLLKAYDAGFATFDDVADQLIGARESARYGTSFSELGYLTARKLNPEHAAFLDRHPEVKSLVERIRSTLLDIELARGDAATVSTDAILSIDSYFGIETLLRVLKALGKSPFKTTNSWSGRRQDRLPTLTSLAQSVYPAEGETPADFAKAVAPLLKSGEVTEERLIELSFLGPQWIVFVEAALKWPGFAEGIYWFLAHMKHISANTHVAAEGAGHADERAEETPPPEATESEDADTDGDTDSTTETEATPQPRKKLSPWERLVLERTTISDTERSEGAIDIAWFHRAHEGLGAKRWLAMADAAKFAASTIQAKQAQLLADTLLGKASRKELIAGIKTKKLKDYVRLLGLLPLAPKAKRETDLKERYKVLVEYRQYAKQLSGLTKPSAMRALEIGMANLARTAGYVDPLRLEWAMEGESVADLAKGPVSATKDGVTVTLALDDMAMPVVTFARGEKTLKSLPPAIKKDKKIAAVVERVADIKRQSSRVKQSLEAAMCRGDIFTAADVIALANHALIAPLWSRLVLISDSAMGYPVKGGKALRDHAGNVATIKKADTLRIAHAYDLYAGKEWPKWQRDCFAAERIQPFKQIFRELYLVTKTEQNDKNRSQRYTGQQIQPTQAMALWGSRRWNTQDGVFKVFHAEGLICDVDFTYAPFTAVEVEGLTVGEISFRKRDDYKSLPLKQVPPMVFSEAMRDIDLVVSVAHRGGVDPEASASTVEMRATLVEETCRLLGLKNVKLKAPHATIQGELGQYSLHLGSGSVHRMPGGFVCIVPIHAQHRGRLFLPFADNDPKTAEIVSKVLLLAKDKEIQDPTILSQLVGT